MKRFISFLFLLSIGLILIAGNVQAKTSLNDKTTNQTEKIEKKAQSSKKAANKKIVNINTADAKTLQTLPGVGEKIAQRIIDHRKKQKFTSPDDLLQVKGIGEKALQRLIPLISVH